MKVQESTPLYTLKKLQSDLPKEQIKSSQSGVEYIRQFYSDDIEIFESFFILCLDRSNSTIGYAKISQGGISSTVVDVKVVAHYAVQNLASAIIIAHNHPSGNKEASQQDVAITKKIRQALSILDIQLLDHLILTSDSYLSMADEGISF